MFSHPPFTPWERARDVALELLSPTRCVACERPGSLVCDACSARIKTIDPVFACLRCGAPFGSLLCTECQSESSQDDRGANNCLAACVFEGVPARIVRAYKDGGERRLAAWIARALFAAACRAQEAVPKRMDAFALDVDAVVFVPATPAAYRRRGFDHMEAVACEFADLIGIPVLDALAKQDAYDQRKLDRGGRLANAEDAYSVVESVAGMRLLLIDDVITTGATMSSCAEVLKRAGAVKIDCLAFARVW